MTCSCGRECKDGAVFCDACGVRLDTLNEKQSETSGANNSQDGERFYTVGNTGVSEDLARPLSLGQYMLMLLISVIPIAGIVMLFVWGFSMGTNINKKNFARAMLIYSLIGFAIVLLLVMVFVPMLFMLIDRLPGFYAGY